MRPSLFLERRLVVLPTTSIVCGVTAFARCQTVNTRRRLRCVTKSQCVFSSWKEFPPLTPLGPARLATVPQDLTQPSPLFLCLCQGLFH